MAAAKARAIAKAPLGLGQRPPHREGWEVERADFASHFDVVGTILPIHLNGRVVAPHESMEPL